MDWEEWAPLLFLGKERHQVGKEDKEIVKEVGFFLLRVEGSRLFFQIRDRYWPDSEMGASPANDLAKLRDIFRWEHL